MTFVHGDCLEAMKKMPDGYVDAIVTDPPYEISFMASKWDNSGVAFDPKTWKEVLRVLKPGGNLIAFGATRTMHRITCAIEDGGFQVRDGLVWLQGQGFPKSLNLDGGWGTALKPSFEPITLARKPFKGTVQNNVTRYGTGALNIAGCAIGEGERWPANVVVSHTEECIHVGETEVPGREIRRPTEKMLPFGGGAGALYETINFPPEVVEIWDCVPGCPVDDLGEPSRYFYCSKVSPAERNAGLENTHNIHPTVKPIDLMRWLCRLITPPGGKILDPFMGSGSTGIGAILEGFDFIGIEQSLEYLGIAEGRVNFWLENGEEGLRIVAERDRKIREAQERRQVLDEMGQMSFMDSL